VRAHKHVLRELGRFATSVYQLMAAWPQLIRQANFLLEVYLFFVVWRLERLPSVRVPDLSSLHKRFAGVELKRFSKGG